MSSLLTFGGSIFTFGILILNPDPVPQAHLNPDPDMKHGFFSLIDLILKVGNKRKRGTNVRYFTRWTVTVQCASLPFSITERFLSCKLLTSNR
jgi:hypothetical protein